MFLNSAIEVLLSVYSVFSPQEKAYYDSIYEPTVVGVPPAAIPLRFARDASVGTWTWKVDDLTAGFSATGSFKVK